MLDNPILNAFLGEAYIVFVVSLIQFVESHTGGMDTWVTPIAVLSLFVLSALVMGAVFLSRPAELYLAGEKREAFRFLSTEVIAFGVLAVLAFVLLLSGVFAG